MKNPKGRPSKKEAAKKQKVTLSLDRKIYSAAKKMCFEEGVSLSQKIDTLFGTLSRIADPLQSTAIQTGLSPEDLIEAAITHLVRVYSARNGKIILPMLLDEIVEQMQKTRGRY